MSRISALKNCINMDNLFESFELPVDSSKTTLNDITHRPRPNVRNLMRVEMMSDKEQHVFENNVFRFVINS